MMKDQVRFKVCVPILQINLNLSYKLRFNQWTHSKLRSKNSQFTFNSTDLAKAGFADRDVARAGVLMSASARPGHASTVSDNASQDARAMAMRLLDTTRRAMCGDL